MSANPVITNIDEALWIRPHVEQIGEQAKRPLLFEDIAAACREARAFLFTQGESFVVLRPMPQLIVQVWVAYSREGDATQKYLPSIRALCRQIGATQIEFETAVGAVERLMPRHGWKKAFTTWRLPLNEI